MEQAARALHDPPGDQHGVHVAHARGGDHGADRVVDRGQSRAVGAQEHEIGLLAGAQRPDPVLQAEDGGALDRGHAQHVGDGQAAAPDPVRREGGAHDGEHVARDVRHRVDAQAGGEARGAEPAGLRVAESHLHLHRRGHGRDAPAAGQQLHGLVGEPVAVHDHDVRPEQPGGVQPLDRAGPGGVQADPQAELAGEPPVGLGPGDRAVDRAPGGEAGVTRPEPPSVAAVRRTSSSRRTASPLPGCA
nr:hypothetical protein GCM10020093_044430 [Planobispora longispora]